MTECKNPPISSNIFPIFLRSCYTKCTFSITDRLRRGTLSVALSDCLMNKMEKDAVSPADRSSIVDMWKSLIIEETKLYSMSYLKSAWWVIWKDKQILPLK